MTDTVRVQTWVMTPDEAVAEVRRILNGIDRDELDDGWWETSTAAAFGAARLAEVEALIRTLSESATTSSDRPG